MKSKLNFIVKKTDGEIYDMHELGVWVSSFHIYSPNVGRNKISVPGMAGAYLGSTEEQERKIDIEMQIEADDMKEYDEKKHILFNLFYSEENLTIVRDLTPEKEVYAVQEGEYDIDDITCYDGEFAVSLSMLDPYVYGEEQTKSFTSDILTLPYKGTAPASPIFELEVLKPVTFAMIQNGSGKYQMIGTPVEAGEEVVDTKELLLEERGQTLDTWSDTPTKVDGGVVAGRLSTDNDAITVPSYGSDTNNWHGPALIKEIPPTQDFEIEMMLSGETGEPDQTYRIEFYLYDENMNVLGKMALLDKSLGINRKIAEGRMGGYEGKQQNYLISSQNYSYGWPYFFGMLRLRRIGRRFEFYVTRIANNTEHVYFLDKPYTDNAGEYMGKLKYVQIHIGKWADSARAYAPRILHIKAFRLLNQTIDTTPYIAYPGDRIIFDNLNKKYFLNGEDAKKHTAMGNSSLSLQKGDNQLIVHPPNSFKANAKWRDRYR